MTSRSASTGPGTFDDRPGSLEQELEVSPERPCVYVLQVEAHHILEGGAAAPLHLPETCDARLRFEHATPMPEVVVVDFIRDGRSRADQGHGTHEHVEQLREFVKAGSAYEVA